MEKRRREGTLCIIPRSPLPASTSSAELSLRGIVKSLCHPSETCIQFCLPLHVLPSPLGLLQHQLKKKKKGKRGKKYPPTPLLMWEVSAPPEGLWDVEHAHLETNFGSLPSLKADVGAWAVYHLCHSVGVWAVTVVRKGSVSSRLRVLWYCRMISSPLSCSGMPVFVCKGGELPWSLICLVSAAFAGQENRQVGRFSFQNFQLHYMPSARYEANLCT